MADNNKLVSIKDDKLDSFLAVGKACKEFNLSFSALIVELTIIGFETGKWGVLLDKKHKKNVVTTAEIVSDDMQGTYTGDEEWIRL